VYAKGYALKPLLVAMELQDAIATQGYQDQQKYGHLFLCESRTPKVNRIGRLDVNRIVITKAHSEGSNFAQKVEKYTKIAQTTTKPSPQTGIELTDELSFRCTCLQLIDDGISRIINRLSAITAPAPG